MELELMLTGERHTLFSSFLQAQTDFISRPRLELPVSVTLPHILSHQAINEKQIQHHIAASGQDPPENPCLVALQICGHLQR